MVSAMFMDGDEKASFPSRVLIFSFIMFLSLITVQPRICVVTVFIKVTKVSPEVIFDSNS